MLPNISDPLHLLAAHFKPPSGRPMNAQQGTRKQRKKQRARVKAARKANRRR